MSDPQYPSPSPSGEGGPYGGQSPYGQQPYGQPTPGQQQPYGQQPGYGQQPFGVQQRDPDKRPGTVLAAGLITAITSALVFVLCALGALGTDAALDEARPDIERALRENDFGDLDFSDVQSAAVAFFVVFAVWALISTVLGILALGRRNWARILTVISASVAGLVTLVLGLIALVPWVITVACIAAIVLFFVGGAGDWYSRRSSAQQQLPTGTSQPWG